MICFQVFSSNKKSRIYNWIKSVAQLEPPDEKTLLSKLIYYIYYVSVFL